MIRCTETHFAFAFPLIFLQWPLVSDFFVLTLLTMACYNPTLQSCWCFLYVCAVSFSYFISEILMHHAHPSPPLPATNEFIYIVTSRFIYFKKRFVLLLCCCCCRRRWWCCCFVILQCNSSLIPFSKFHFLFGNHFIYFLHLFYLSPLWFLQFVTPISCVCVCMCLLLWFCVVSNIWLENRAITCSRMKIAINVTMIGKSLKDTMHTYTHNSWEFEHDFGCSTLFLMLQKLYVLFKWNFQKFNSFCCVWQSVTICQFLCCFFSALGAENNN